MHTIITRSVATFALIALMTPGAVSAQSVSDIQSQIKSLMDQIKALQTQLIALRASSTPPVPPKWNEGTATSTHPMPPKAKWCISLVRNIRLGDRGDDIRQLQDMLREDGRFGFNASSTGFFGPMTAQAMAKWQMMNNVASSTDGSVGPKTRAFFRDCGMGNQGDTNAPSALRNLGDKLRDFFGIGDEDRRDQAAGKVKSVSSSSFVIERPNGFSRTINVTASTTIKVVAASSSQPTTGTMADILVEKLVIAEGTGNADGSLTALHVKVGVAPMMHGMPKLDVPPFPPTPKMPDTQNPTTNSGRQ
ncbi:peptidoglycan-binding protein [Candidatus Kaiserbacteria bacterium]|nr:peptidoglycan-binding protein [Candidatus Kaiserbacteria bacterium]